jgi:hypothetical protein
MHKGAYPKKAKPGLYYFLSEIQRKSKFSAKSPEICYPVVKIGHKGAKPIPAKAGDTKKDTLCLSVLVAIGFKGLFVDRLKKLCLITGTFLLMALAVLCIIGAVMGTDWSKWFFAVSTGRWLWVCIALLIIAGLSQFKEIYTTKWPFAVYLGALLVLAAGVTNCPCTLYAGYLIGCIGLFGLFRFKPDKVDIAVTVILLIATVLVFIFVSLPSQLKSVFFIPHVFACFLSYIFIARAVYFAAKGLFDKKATDEEAAYRLVCIGFPFLTAGIALGSIWAASAWQDWWGWDPKETFSLAVWLVFAAFFHFRYLYRQKFLRLNSIWIIFGFILIIFGVLLVNFAKIFAGLHSHSA